MVDPVKSLYLQELTDEFLSLKSYRGQDVDRWLSAAIPIVNESQSTIAEIADIAFDAEIYALLGDVSSDPIDLSLVTGGALRNGVPPEEVYARAFKPVWQGTGNGLDLQESVAHGVSRLSEMFQLDSERVIDHVAIEKFANENRIVGYKRVLSGAHNCALCILASTQVYHKRELKGIHPNCKCTVRPVASFENSNTLDRDLIEQVHREVQNQFGISDKAARQIDYRKILFTREHGEYGPTLTYRQYNFTGPSDLKTPGE